jgi:adenylylsulfate kinase
MTSTTILPTPFVIWMTGLPCSGKTTIAKNLQKSIPDLAILDGDELREWLPIKKDFQKWGDPNII